MSLEQMDYVVKKLKELKDELGRIPRVDEFKKRFPNILIEQMFKTYDGALVAAGLLVKDVAYQVEYREPKILCLDIETKPIKAWTYRIWDTSIPIEFIIEDWNVRSWAAKWLGNDEVFYQDTSSGHYTDDKAIVQAIRDLIHKADAVLTQNGVKFDIRKLNERYDVHGIEFPKPFRHIDTLKIKKKVYGLTSNSLAFSTQKFNETHVKDEHRKFPGNHLALQCIAGNPEAWEENKFYNIKDVLATEELYLKTLRKHDTTINHGVYTGLSGSCPNCGSQDLNETDPIREKTKIVQNFVCRKCKTQCRGTENLLKKDARKGLMK